MTKKEEKIIFLIADYAKKFGSKRFTSLVKGKNKVHQSIRKIDAFIILMHFAEWCQKYGFHLTYKR